jgi:hypothetical protein
MSGQPVGTPSVLLEHREGDPRVAARMLRPAGEHVVRADDPGDALRVR